MKLSFYHADCYLQYIQKACPDINPNTLSLLIIILENTSWDNPNSSLDWNNLAVLALIEAEQCADNLEMRSIYLETAFEALDNGLKLDSNPLCAAHLALIHSMIGETEEAMQKAFHTFINTIYPAYNTTGNIPPGLIYLSFNRSSFAVNQYSNLKQIIEAENSYSQSLLLLSEVLGRSQLVFYNTLGFRFLHLAAQLFPTSVSIGLKLGISSLMSGQWEGILYLHRARQLAMNSAAVLQSLYLAYRDLKQIEVADFWLKTAQNICQQNSNSPDWRWTELARNSSLTYVPFQKNLTMAVEPSFRSIVTSVLIAEGDWFEKEMEFWRNWIKPGMTVIDVGANVGVYTFSAALQVGEKGRVLAIEPFSGCVRCLQETCRINQLSWVTICAGAASERNGTARLSLQAASELNEIVDADVTEMMNPGTFEEVSCFTLDSLIEQHNISHVDFLKIDAEGHELQVLVGSERILSEFSPVILYENIAGTQGSNFPVANFLITQGYQLFQYKPHIQELIPINSIEELPRNLNIIALPVSGNKNRTLYQEFV